MVAFMEDQRAVVQKFLDLLHTKPQSKEEVQNLLYKLPELKLRSEKTTDDPAVLSNPCQYLNPIPSSMSHVNIQQLSKVHIDWKMLILERPETMLEMNIFSRIVFLHKITYECVEREKRKRERMNSFRWKKSPVTERMEEEDSTDEFTYEYFSRFAGSHDRSGKGMEETTKPPTEQPITKKSDPTIRTSQEQSKVVSMSLLESKKRKRSRKPRRVKSKRKRKKRPSQEKKKKKKKTIGKPRQKRVKSRKMMPKTSIQLLKKTEKSERKKMKANVSEGDQRDGERAESSSRKQQKEIMAE